MNQLLPKPIPVAVVAVKSAGTFRLAPAPKIIPAGFIRNKLEVPFVTWMRPLITEGFPPTTRPKMFWMFG